MTQAGSASQIASDDVYVFPVSFAQQRLWFLEQLVPGTCFYNVPTVFRLTGALNLAALEASLNEIVRRHEVLRTTFGMEAGQPVQLVATHLSVAVPLLDLQYLPVGEREAAAQELIREEIQQPFDLVTGPLLRVLLLQLSATEYVLAINLHHIIFDEWSIAILIRELGRLYSAFCGGKPSPLPELPLQYADVAHWQRQWLRGEVLQKQLSYWQKQLQNLPALNLPGCHPRASTPSYAGTTQFLEISEDVTAAAKILSQQEGVTLFMTLLTAFGAFLSRYSGQTDIAVGSPIANRNRQESEDLIGFFANTLVLRTDVSGNPSFRELLGRVRQVTLGAFAHQDLPFEKLVEELHPQRHLGRNPLFQVVFALQNAPMSQLTLPELTLTPFPVEVKTTRFDLELYLWECGDNFRSLWGEGWERSQGLRGVLVYNTDLFESGTITRMLEHFQTLLAAAFTSPDTSVNQLPLLTASEQKLLWEWNQTQRDYPDKLCIHQLFEAGVTQHPHAVALHCGNREYTYEDLNSGSNQLAHYLRGLNVGTETLVGICMEPTAAMIAVLLAILKAGAAYVPLDPNYPPQRLQFMLTDAQVSVLITQSDISWELPNQNIKIICLEKDWEIIAQESEENPVNLTNAEHLAYVIYTSGSTGIPKGVAVPHRGVNRLVCNPNYITFSPTDKVAQCANIAFDAATFEIWGALLNGVQLVLINRDLLLSPADFAMILQQQEISILFLTTALFNQIAREVPEAFSSLRYLLFGGEAVDIKWVQAVWKSGAPRHLIHVYGPTENTTFTTWYEVENIPNEATFMPIGRAVANTQVYLLDSYFQPVPVGVVGEIYIGGDGLARGYLHRQKLTAERFIEGQGRINKSKLSTFNSALLTQQFRLYKTGDLARYLADGNLEFVGRVDCQVKLRGFRIELGEIEAVLSQHPLVVGAVVVLRDDVLVGYVVFKVGESLTNGEMRSFLQVKLPDYMIPGVWVVLPSLPLTTNGKVDRRALPPPNMSQQRLAEKILQPRTDVEAELVEIWGEILGLEVVGIEDNFFELGGHSLLATQVVSRIRDRFGIQLPLRTLFTSPTIVTLAPHITRQHREEVEF